MSVAQTESTLRDYLAALLNGGDFASYFSDDIVCTVMETGDEVRGRDAAREYVVALHTQLFDATPEVRNIAFGDGIAALEAVFVAKHTGEFAGIPATGVTIQSPYSIFFDVDDDGRITALRAYFPMIAIVQELQAKAAASSN
ncbi:nuclear transport factor 2 family protein [Kribbella sp. NPDC048915]|uniref:nuclear transport factor 2 family protein n=1 Tax=Kribbella sp. NPDC048915 TaxID=3155148 RepID=UPI0034055FE7